MAHFKSAKGKRYLINAAYSSSKAGYEWRAFVFVVEELEPFEGCAASSIEWAPYVHPVYRHEAIFKVYEIEFPLISDESLWSEWYGTILCPNLVMRRKATGMPISTRFQNDKDEVERHEKRCGLYRQVGHTRRGCPNQPTRDA
ncbi:hypothetical protein Ahy_B07g086374 [Arachis hypogaea]|uniref:Transposase MuDR plant domain-containing protein n=1 Tax=Arachis hypogaea TaxID=3818 RepID=A0A444Y9J8_ARAHY|nr:hypothetical protein Ahy_B07g086374 [Arachis hypogaea]